MSTLRESLQAEIIQIETSLNEKKQKLVTLEQEASTFLSLEVENLKAFFGSFWQHLGL